MPEERAAWLADVPALARECAGSWQLELGAPFQGAHASVVMPATRRDGTEVVLKLQHPHRESEHEADALQLWDGDGAIRLLERDAERHALLLERCLPGTALSEGDPDAALDVLAGLLPRLWKPAAPPLRPLAEEAAWWAETLPDEWERAGRPFERELLETALGALRELPSSQGEQVVLHQDLHADNVLAAEREPWLAIDPKPLVGEREFGVAPIVRSSELGHGEARVRRRLDRLAADLGLDRERARLWSLAQTVAWCFDSEFRDRHVETARWLLRA